MAADQACLDRIRQAHGKDLAEMSYPELDGQVQLVHGEKIGLGTRKYALLEIR